MKKFVFILVCLFFVNANAQNNNNNNGGGNFDPAAREKLKNCEIAIAAQAACTPEDQTFSTPSSSGVANITCKTFRSFLRQCDGSAGKDDGEECRDMHREYSKAKKEALKEEKKDIETAQEKLTELKQDLADRVSEAQEQIAEAEEREQQAVIAFEAAENALQTQLDEIEKSTNEAGQELVKNLQDMIAELEKIITVDRDEVNTEFQNSIMQGYEACKQSAEAFYDAKMKIVRGENLLENTSKKFSGGATFATGSDKKRIKKEALAMHKTCISETKRVLESKRDAALQKSALAEKRLNQEIEAKTKELNRITNDEYQKKLKSLNKELQNAQKTMISAQEKATKDKQRLAEKMSKDQLTLDTEISLVQARANAGQNPAGRKTKGAKLKVESDGAYDDAYYACCEGSTLKSGVSGTSGTPPNTFCKGTGVWGSGKKGGR